jgi:hypothetical protein
MRTTRPRIEVSRSPAQRICRHPRRRAGGSGWRRAASIRSELDLKLEGPQGLSHIVNCLLHRGYSNGTSVIAEACCSSWPTRRRAESCSRSTVPDAGCAKSVSRKKEWSPDVFTKARPATGCARPSAYAMSNRRFCRLAFWKMNSTVVERLVTGRIVLCGDAAHQFPPTGGLGVNTGLQGMHNAMWKLAYCLKGDARWPLLHTYDDERREVSQRITSQSLENSINVLRIVAAATAATAG